MKNSRNNTIIVNRKSGKTTVREVSTELKFRGSPVSCWAVKMNAITKRSPPICWFYWASALRTMCNNLLAIRLNIWAVSAPQHGSLNMNNSGGSRVLGPLLLILSHCTVMSADLLSALGDIVAAANKTVKDTSSIYYSTYLLYLSRWSQWEWCNMHELWSGRENLVL